MLHRLSRKSVETVTSSSNQKLISRNSRKSLPKEFTAQLDDQGTEQEKWCTRQSEEGCPPHGIGMIIFGRLCQETCFWQARHKKMKRREGGGSDVDYTCGEKKKKKRDKALR